MMYYRSQEEYVWNYSKVTVDSGYTFQTSLATCQYVLYNFFPSFIVIGLYISSPWKEPIYRNYLLFIVILVNLATTGALAFLMPTLKDFFSFTDMTMKSMGIIFMIAMLTCILSVAFNVWIQWLQLHQSLKTLQPLSNENERLDTRSFMPEG